MKYLPINFLLIIVAFALIAVDAKFPDDPQPCKFGDSNCIIQSFNYYLAEQSNGDSSIALVNINPLKIKKIIIEQHGESPVNIKLTFLNNYLYGLNTTRAYKSRKGFGKDLTKKIEIRLKSDILMMIGDYEVDGKILVLPITGKGKSNLTLIDNDCIMQFSGTPYRKNGDTYMKVNNMKLRFKPKQLYSDFTNLFNGDKELGDNMNLFLNENWKAIFDELHDKIAEAFARIYESVITNVFTKYPYEKYFIE
ncbi:protein takeout-like [Teleopsis dalmanni]|uniref:protein takeout-like n=1 Tax=Teleopsis dalmanni TaxID=139649 RepID=UPI0018CF2632|nr:protein takeout-like [Teleopsis dalmanni]